MTVNRRTGPRVENDDYAAFTRRVVAAQGRRIAAGDIDNLAGLGTLAEDVERAVTTAVAGLRAAGFSWSEIAGRLGVTRQAAQQRWRIPAPTLIASPRFSRRPGIGHGEERQ